MRHKVVFLRTLPVSYILNVSFDVGINVDYLSRQLPIVPVHGDSLFSVRCELKDINFVRQRAICALIIPSQIIMR